MYYAVQNKEGKWHLFKDVKGSIETFPFEFNTKEEADDYIIILTKLERKWDKRKECEQE